MTQKNHVAIVIPVYQESKVLEGVIKELFRHRYTNIIIVDDGSTDDSFAVAKNMGVMVLRHTLNRGKGAAIKTGIAAAGVIGADVVVSFDGDGQHDPSDIPQMLSFIHKGYDVVLGSRFIKKLDIPVIKKVGNYCANVITYFLYGIWVTDSQSGLRAYSKRAFSRLDRTSDRYEFDSVVLREIRHNHLPFIEFPMHVRYTEYSQQKQYRQHFISAILTAMRLIVSS